MPHGESTLFAIPQSFSLQPLLRPDSGQNHLSSWLFMISVLFGVGRWEGGNFSISPGEIIEFLEWGSGVS